MAEETRVRCYELMEEYEVMEEVCEKEVLAFLDKLEQAGILEEV